MSDVRHRIPVLVLYEHILTLVAEIRLFWSVNLTGAVVLFFFNRYVNSAIAVFAFTGFIPVSDEVRDGSPPSVPSLFLTFL